MDETEIITSTPVEKEGMYIPETQDEYSKIYIPQNTRLRLNSVITQISPFVKQQILLELVKILSTTFNRVECTPVEIREEPYKHNNFLINEFITARKVEGRSSRTLEYYESTIRMMFKWFGNKHVEDITTGDIREYFSSRMEHDQRSKESYKSNKGKAWSLTTLDNNRRILHTFFDWCVTERYILHNPVKGIKATKTRKQVKKAFSNLEIEAMRDCCRNTRERAMFELLLSSGMRVGEMVRLNIDDLDMMNNECMVLGKGNKERVCYFNEVTKFYLKKYLEERKDYEQALFVSLNQPHTRVGVTGAETSMRQLGLRAGLTKVHPHRFRHTFAVNCINKGIPLEQVQQLLGHQLLDTTLIYAKVAREDVKYSHKKMMN